MEGDERVGEREKGCVAKTHHFTLVSRAGRDGGNGHI